MPNKNKRVFELAKQYGVTNQRMITVLQGLGFDIKSHFSCVDDNALLKRELEGQIKKNRTIQEKREERIVQTEIERLRKENNTLLKERALEDKIVNLVEKVIPQMKIPIYKETTSKEKKVKETLGMLFSDTHLGEVVDPDAVGGLAEYNFDIFKKRLHRLVEGTLGFALDKMKGYKFDKMAIWFLGDMVSGMIHEELEASSDKVAVDQVFQGAAEIANALNQLSKYIPQMHCICLAGNHARLHRKKRFKNIYNNWDFVLYKTLELMLKQNNRITFKIPKSFWSYDTIEGHSFLSMHGDNVKSWGAYPHYGIDRMEARFAGVLASQQKYFEYLLLAHFHSVSAMDRVKGEKIVNGSFTGGDEYSMGALTEMRLPKQLIFGINSKLNRGVTWRLPLTLN